MSIVPIKKEEAEEEDSLWEPTSVVLLFSSFLMELIDWFFSAPFHVALPGKAEPILQAILAPLDLFFMIYKIFLTGESILKNFLFFLIERIPILGNILPTWFISCFFIKKR